MTVSSAFNTFAETVVIDHRIPFELTAEISNIETEIAIANVRNGIWIS